MVYRSRIFQKPAGGGSHANVAHADTPFADHSNSGYADTPHTYTPFSDVFIDYIDHLNYLDWGTPHVDGYTDGYYCWDNHGDVPFAQTPFVDFNNFGDTHGDSFGNTPFVNTAHVDKSGGTLPIIVIGKRPDKRIYFQ